MRITKYNLLDEGERKHFLVLIREQTGEKSNQLPDLIRLINPAIILAENRTVINLIELVDYLQTIITRALYR